MRSSLLLQQYPACFVRFIWTVLEIGGKWPYNCCSVGCCFQDSFNVARSILMQLLSSFFSTRFVNVHVEHPDNRIDTTNAWKKLHLYNIFGAEFLRWSIHYFWKTFQQQHTVFNSLRGTRIHKARWCEERNSPAGECKSIDGPMSQVYPHRIHEPIADHQRPGDIFCKPRI